MFNPHIHQQQQQQQQFHQHLRQLQQLFQQQPPPPPPPQPPPGHHVGHHHHQTPRAIPVPPQTAPPPRMVNLCQATQTTIITPNPMLQGAILMQQMQGNMRNFGMGGQQFRQFFAAGARSSLLGPVPMGMAIKSPIMGFPAARPFHPHHARYYNNNTPTAPSSSSSSTTSTTDTAGHQTDRKRDNKQMAANSTNEPGDKSETDDAVGEVDGPTHLLEEELQEPPVKKLKESDEPKQQYVVKTVPSPDADGQVVFSEYNCKTDESQLEDGVILEDRGSTVGSDVVEAVDEIKADEMHSCLSPSKRLAEDDQQLQLSPEEITQEKDASFGSPENREEGEEGVAEGANKFYCYLCSITCHNQQNFRSHMNSISHKQRMMEIQHMSNACLVTLLPRVQESLQGTNKDGENKAESKRWCATCDTHFTSSIVDHRRTEEHKLASRKAISSCTVCKKYFKTSQIFVEHLQSQEHRQKVEKLQEGCESFAKLTDMDTDGFFLEEEEGSDTETAEDSKSNEVCLEEKQDGWSSFKEVTLKDMACDEKYDPDTVYGSSFFVPVAGFICRLCHKFYHFESSGLHTHCKSRKHFENLKAYRSLLSQKGEDVESSRVSLLAEGSSRPTSETTTDCSEKNSYCSDTGLESNLNSMQPIITLTRLKMQAESQEQEKEAEPNPASQDFITISAASTSSTNQELPSREEKTISQGSIDQGSLAELDAVKREEPDSEMAADAEGAHEEEAEKEAPAAPGKKNGTGKAKGTSKRRSGRATNRH